MIHALLAQAQARPLESTGLVLAVSLFVMLLLHIAVRTLNAGNGTVSGRIRARLGIRPGKTIAELRWLLVSVHLVAWPCLAWLVLWIWGKPDVGGELIRGLVSAGIDIGGLHVVPGRVLLALVYCLMLWTLSRWLKTRLQDDWLLRVGMEASTRESVATLFGYASFAVAVVVGLSAGGFDFTKLTIIAGALSVGIGFGLQNIVNNFVSGLIILFERPVRTGDYIVVGQTEGFVRRIRIRSTEIETYHRETIIVPNSDLLSNHLKNFHLRDLHGRVTVQVGVAYGSDTARVQRELEQVALANPNVLREGDVEGIAGPRVLFTNFGASSLDFELRTYVRNVDERFVVASQLRLAVDAAFRAADIQIPFPQQDVWFRNAAPESTAAQAARGRPGNPITAPDAPS
ncbi:MAG TPA: mechanosensitive ion channel domain-containing protein [Fontimonas sp.]